MISVRFSQKSDLKTREVFEGCFQFSQFRIPVDKMADYIATIMISHIRKRFLRQTNPDGTIWPVSKAASTRMAGGFTYAKGGKFAPGGWKTATKTLFSSGNLFHSIQLVKRSLGEYVIGTDVDYARDYMNDDRTIIGTNEKELTTITDAVVRRML